MAYLVPVVVIVLLIYVFVTSNIEDDIKKYGVVAEAIVTRVNERSHLENDKKSGKVGERVYSYTYYVSYQNQKGETIETKLRTPDLYLLKGQKIHIKYSPKRPKYVIAAQS